MSVVSILYVEDDPGSARLLQKRLTSAGYNVDTAENGEIGLARANEQAYDVIIVDQNMPGLSGLQVIERLLKQPKPPVTIMLTASGNEGIAVEALKVGANDYLVKDLDGIFLELLPSVINQCIQQRQILEEKQKAEEALQTSEIYYRSLIEHSLDMIVVTDEQGVIRYVSPSIKNIFDLTTEEELLGKSGLAVIDPSGTGYLEGQQLESAMTFFRLIMENPGRLEELELEAQSKTGDKMWLEVRGRNLLHEPRIKSLIFHIRNVSERHTASQALRESEERFRTLFQQAPDAYIIADMEGNVLDINPAAAVIVAATREQIVGKNIVELNIFDPTELARLWGDYNASPPTSSHFEIETRIRRHTGEHIEVEIRAIPVSVNGEDRILAIARDITWRKHAEMTLKTQNQQLVNLSKVDEELTRKLDLQYVLAKAVEILAGISNAVAGAIIIANGNEFQLIRTFGYSEAVDIDELREKSSIASRVMKTGNPEWVRDVSVDEDYLARRADTESQITFPLVSQDKVIGVIILEANRAENFDEPLFEFLKLVASRIAVAIDNAQLFEITQQQIIQLRDLNTQISKFEQLKSDMIRMAAHDLGNPLTSVMLYSNLLKKSLRDTLTEKHLEYLGRVEAAANHMKAIIGDFLSLDRIEGMAKDTLNRQKFDLVELVEKVYTDYCGQAEIKEQAFRFNRPSAPIEVSGYEPELRQAAANIIGNAVKYTPNCGTIEIVVLNDGEEARFVVTDTGYGVPEDMQSRLFDPFFRAKTPETNSIEGTGLGLYLVKKIVERNEGEMLFQSTLGKGSSFGFTLPLSEIKP
ncbi:MAG: PAS domain S-box protein [Anaerolineae bacterium]